MNETSAAQKLDYGVGVYPSRGITLVSGTGAKVWDDQGRVYIDCATGIGVASIGHANQELVTAIRKQAERLIVCAGVFSNDVRDRCMEKIVSITPDGLDRVFLCNSGAESIEGAIKFARQSTGRSKVISAMRGFHGRTFGALSATPKRAYQDPFGPLVPEFHHIPFNRTSALERVADQDTAALILELVQGEGGVRPADRAFIERAAQLCRQLGILLVIDEVQTGFCRTGTFFACEQYELEPDILCLAKGIAGGVPMGAIVVNKNVRTAPGTHGSTFGGNPLACAAALKTIEIMERDRLAERAFALGDYFVSRLARKLPGVVRDIRYRGLMIGVELRTKATPVLKALQQQGVLALPAGTTVIRLLPPLVISKSELDYVLDKLLLNLQSSV